MKFKRICVITLIIVCFAGFGVWAKIASEKPIGQPGGNGQHTYFYDTKGPEHIMGINWEKEYEGNGLPMDLVLFKEKVVCVNTDSVICVEGATGKELWKYTFKSNNSTLDKFTYSFSALACYDGVVYFPDGKNILGLDLDNGVEKWSYQQEFGFSITVLMLQDGVIYYGSQDGVIHALNIKNKKERWKIEKQDEIINMAIEKGTIFINTEKKLIAANLKSGKELWKTDIINFGGLTVGEKYIYLKGNSRGGVETILSAFDKKTGKEVWNYKPEKQEEHIYDRIAYHEGRVFIITYTMDMSNYSVKNSTIRALDERNGKELWNFGSEVMFTNIAVCKNGLYSSASSGQLIKLNPQNGAKENTMDMKYGYIISPIMKEGKVYFIGTSSEEVGGEWYFGKTE